MTGVRISTNVKRFVRIALIGALVGVVTFALGFVLEKYVITPIGCDAQSTIIKCGSAPQISHNVALLLGGAVGLILLVRRGLFRPLLVVLGAVASLWGVGAMATNFGWIAATLFMVLVCSLVYSLFAWIAQPRRFWVAFALTVAAVIALRLALNL